MRGAERLKKYADDLMAHVESVDHPAHYGGDTVYEAIKVIEAWELDFCLGNAVKYISRAGKKDAAVEDLQKAKWYLERKIKQLEKENASVSNHPRFRMFGQSDPACRQRLCDSRGRMGIHKRKRGRRQAARRR